LRYFPQRPRKDDLTTALQVCPLCLGDLVMRSEFSGDYYCCLVCHIRTRPIDRARILPDLPDPIRPHIAAVEPERPTHADATRRVLTG